MSCFIFAGVAVEANLCEKHCEGKARPASTAVAVLNLQTESPLSNCPA